MNINEIIKCQSIFNDGYESENNKKKEINTGSDNDEWESKRIEEFPRCNYYSSDTPLAIVKM